MGKGMLFKAHKIFPAIFKGFIPIRIKGFVDIITDVFINEKYDQTYLIVFEKVPFASKGDFTN